MILDPLDLAMQVSALPKRRPHISYSLRLLFGTLLVFIAFWTYGKVYFYRDPGSLLFFDPSRAYERKYSTYREKEVLEFRKEVIKKIQNNGIEDRSDRTKDYQVCAVIVSVDRKINGMNVHPLEVCIPFTKEHLLGARRGLCELSFSNGPLKIPPVTKH